MAPKKKVASTSVSEMTNALSTFRMDYEIKNQEDTNNNFLNKHKKEYGKTYIGH